jgi:hypothetical protein
VDSVPDEVLDRNPPRFAMLMGRHINYGWRDTPPRVTVDACESVLMASIRSIEKLGLEKTNDPQTCPRSFVAEPRTPVNRLYRVFPAVWPLISSFTH